MLRVWTQDHCPVCQAHSTLRGGMALQASY
jgi:hypothetical protein